MFSAHLIHMEVQALMASNSGLTEDQCTTKCDGLFDLVDGHDETQTDNMCKTICSWLVDSLHSLAYVCLSDIKIHHHYYNIYSFW